MKKNTIFETSPNAGYFFINKLAGGLRASFTTARYKEEGYGDYKTTTILISSFATYYFIPESNKVNLLEEVSLRFGST